MQFDKAKMQMPQVYRNPCKCCVSNSERLFYSVTSRSEIEERRKGKKQKFRDRKDFVLKVMEVLVLYQIVTEAGIALNRSVLH